MKGYDLMPFANGKAFIHFDGIKNGKADYGARICINNKGEKLFELPNRDMFVFDFEPEDVAFISNYDNKFAIINNKGEFITDFVYDSICSGSEEGLFEVKRNGKHGHLDLQGREIIPCIYDDGCYFSEGITAECLNGKCGMVDYFNNTVIPFEYEEIFLCKNNLINAKKNGKYGLINKNNEVVVDFLYENIISWIIRDCSVYPVKNNNKWGVIDRYGNIIEDLTHDEAELLSDSNNNIGEFVLFTKDYKKAIYSTKRKEFITGFDYDFIGFISDNRFRAVRDNKAGFIDENGDIAVPFIYDNKHHYDFSEGRSTVSKDDKAGVIDSDGNVIIPFEYERIKYCREGMIWAVDENRQDGFLNRNGETVIPFGKLCTSWYFIVLQTCSRTCCVTNR